MESCKFVYTHVFCCGKSFHYECLRKWEMQCEQRDEDITCPMCRASLCDFHNVSNAGAIERLRTFDTDWARVLLGTLLVKSDYNVIFCNGDGSRHKNSTENSTENSVAIDEGLDILRSSGPKGFSFLAMYYQKIGNTERYKYYLNRAVRAGCIDAYFEKFKKLMRGVKSDRNCEEFFEAMDLLSKAAVNDHDEAVMLMSVLSSCSVEALCFCDPLIIWARDKLQRYDRETDFFRKRMVKHDSRKKYREWLIEKIIDKLIARSFGNST